MKRVSFNPQPNCPNCGGLHFGTRFDNCPYTAEQGAEFRKSIPTGTTETASTPESTNQEKEQS